VILHAAGPGTTLQDAGRPGLAAIGLSRGGAADREALAEAAALLGLREATTAIEMPGMGVTFEVTAPTRVALTGAPMPARVGDRPLAWNASHWLEPGERVSLRGAEAGLYGYVSFPGGIETKPVLGSRAAHLAAGLGKVLEAGARLPLGADHKPDAVPLTLPRPDRFGGGTLRFAEGPQTGLFSDETLARFEATAFTRSATGNRQGVKLDMEAEAFTSEAPKGLASEFIFEGDIQMTGEGTPYVLLAECQTIGGYPRIGTVVPDDLPRIAQARPGEPIRFARVGLDELAGLDTPLASRIAALANRTTPLVRDPATIPDLLAYQLISGVTAGHDLEDTP